VKAFVRAEETVDVHFVEVEAFLVYAYPQVIDVDVRTVAEHYSLVVDPYHNRSCHAHNHYVVDYYRLVMAVDMVDSVTFSVQARLIDWNPMLTAVEMELIGHFHVSACPLAVFDVLVD
jgi:hypothetical protein